MNDILMKILECVISIAVIVICRYVIPYFKNKVGNEKYAIVVSYVAEVVSAMQQTLTDNNIKKETAVERVKNFLNSKGIQISDEEIDTLIESAVKQLKIEEAK